MRPENLWVQRLTTPATKKRWNRSYRRHWTRCWILPTDQYRPSGINSGDKTDIFMMRLERTRCSPSGWLEWSLRAGDRVWLQILLGDPSSWLDVLDSEVSRLRPQEGLVGRYLRGWECFLGAQSSMLTLPTRGRKCLKDSARMIRRSPS